MIRRSTSLLIVVICALAALAGLPGSAARAADAVPGQQSVTFTTRDGYVLQAILIRPAGSGPHPLVVMPSAWGGAADQNRYIGRSLAERGYLFFGYATRGFNGSGGTVDVAGPQSVEDASTAIDWVLAHAQVTKGGVAMIGQSLAANIALVAASRDARIRAVGIVSGWGSLIDAVDQNDTPSDGAIFGVITSGLLNGKMSAETSRIFQDLVSHRNWADVQAWAKVRSPDSYLAGLNRNQPAIFLASGENELVFPTGQTVDFFDHLQGPRTLQLRPGDHGTAEGSGTQGADNVVFDDMYDWFDAYVAHKHAAPTGRHDVMIVPESSNGAKPAEVSSSWAGVARHSVRYELGGRTPLQAAGGIGGKPAATWRSTIVGGVDTPANMGVPLVTYGLEAFTGTPPTTVMPAIDPLNAGIWRSAPLTTTRQLRGRATLHLGITPTTAAGTIVAYLYDVDASGVTGYSITGVPYTWTGRTPGRSFDVTLKFPALGYDVPAGHRLAVVIDTKDVLYHDLTVTGAPITFTSSAADPAHLDLPLR